MEMSIRKRNDADGYRRGAVGIDDDKGGRFTKENRTDPWTVRPASVDYVPGSVSRKDTVKPGKGITDDIGVADLRNKMPDGDPEQGTRSRGGGKDIFDNVNANSDDVSPTRGTGPIKYGVDLDERYLQFSSRQPGGTAACGPGRRIEPRAVVGSTARFRKAGQSPSNASS
jgi:hypothetical protein